MEKPVKKIVIELRVRLAEDLYQEHPVSKDEAVKLYIESSMLETEDLIIVDGQLEAIRLDAKKLIAKNLGEAIDFLKTKLDPTTNEYDDLISLPSKFNRAVEFLGKGIIDYPTADQEFVRIGHAMLHILKGLSSETLKK